MVTTKSSHSFSSWSKPSVSVTVMGSGAPERTASGAAMLMCFAGVARPMP
jgi:hypothetical protein